MAILRKFLGILHKTEDSLLILSLLSMLTMALAQIVMRNLFDSGFLWAESFLRILVLWVAMLGAMVATRERNHINIDILSRYLSDKAMLPVKVLTGLFAAVICMLCAYHSIEFIQYEYEDETIAFGVIPVWVCQSIIPVGFFSMGLRFFISVLKPGAD